MIGFVDNSRFTSIPTGLIVPWASNSAAPTGWSLYAAPNNYYILGAGNTYALGAYAAGGTPTGRVRFTSTTDGAHLGTLHSTVTFKTLQPTWTANWRLTGGATGGLHDHTIEAIPTLGYNQYQLIKATTPMETFPANAILLNTLHYNLPSLTLTGTNGQYLRAGSAVASAGTSLVATIDPTLINGNHQHAWGPGYMNPDVGAAPHVNSYYVFNGASSTTDGLAGYHVHNIISAAITDKIKKAYVTAWTYASAFLGFQGMIGFWDGAITPGAIPTGWALCNGNNGTIDMRDYFLMITTDKSIRGTKTGTNVIDITASSGNMLDSNNFTDVTDGHLHHQSLGNYEHVQDPDNPMGSDNRWKSFYHTQYNIPHSHIATQGTNLSYYPAAYALYMIQKL